MVTKVIGDWNEVTDTKQDTLTGLTATPTELNITDNLFPTQAELNFVDGVTSAIQTQLNAKGSLTEDDITVTNASGTTTAYITLGNLLIQWGSMPFTTGTAVVTFGRAFASDTNYIIVATIEDPSTLATIGYTANIRLMTAAGCSIEGRQHSDTGAGVTDIADLNAKNIMWFAIGQNS